MYPSVSLSASHFQVSVSLHVSICLTPCVSLSVSLCVSLQMSHSMSFPACIHLSHCFCPHQCLSACIHLSHSLPVSLSVCARLAASLFPDVSLSLCMYPSVSLRVSVSLSKCLTVSPHVHLSCSLFCCLTMSRSLRVRLHQRLFFQVSPSETLYMYLLVSLSLSVRCLTPRLSLYASLSLPVSSLLSLFVLIINPSLHTSGVWTPAVGGVMCERITVRMREAAVLLSPSSYSRMTSTQTVRAGDAVSSPLVLRLYVDIAALSRPH